MWWGPPHRHDSAVDLKDSKDPLLRSGCLVIVVVMSVKSAQPNDDDAGVNADVEAGVDAGVDADVVDVGADAGAADVGSVVLDSK